MVPPLAASAVSAVLGGEQERLLKTTDNHHQLTIMRFYHPPQPQYVRLRGRVFNIVPAQLESIPEPVWHFSLRCLDIHENARVAKDDIIYCYATGYRLHELILLLKGGSFVSVGGILTGARQEFGRLLTVKELNEIEPPADPKPKPIKRRLTREELQGPIQILN